MLSAWKEHYQGLYTPSDLNIFDDTFKKFVERQLENYSKESFLFDDDVLEKPFTTDEVSRICLHLSNGKAGGLDGVMYEHLKYAGHDFINTFTEILNVIRLIEDVPKSMIIGLISSLYKGKKKSRLLKENYRGITLLNVFGKVLEHVILERLMPKFVELGIPNNLQYAYQKNKSCSHASFVLQEAIYESVEGSEKAFDNVWFDGLFYKLFNLGIRGKSWRLLRKWYSKLVCRVMVNGLISDTFPVLQGIRQGGVLSPWLFLCFYNDISDVLARTNAGLKLKSMYCGNVIVADDVAMLSPKVTGLQQMIDTMENYSKTWRFKFNIKKTTAVVFGESTRVRNAHKDSRQWFLYGNQINENYSAEHVGAILSGNLTCSSQAAEAASKGKEVISSFLTAGIPIGNINQFVVNSYGLLLDYPRCCTEQSYGVNLQTLTLLPWSA